MRPPWSKLCISWEDTVPSRDVLTRAKIIPTYSLLKQRRLHWLGHVSHMEDGRIPKDSNMVGLAPGRRPRGRARLGFKDLASETRKSRTWTEPHGKPQQQTASPGDSTATRVFRDSKNTRREVAEEQPRLKDLPPLSSEYTTWFFFNFYVHYYNLFSMMFNIFMT